MVKRIYRGSAARIEQPVFGAGNPANDYGLGFYCTESLDLALEWAVDDERDGFANAYDIQMDGLDALDLSAEGTCCDLQWLAVLLENRTFDTASALAREAKDFLLANFLPDYRDRDVIIGYRADDSYFAFAQDFISGGISYRQLGNAMRLDELGLQFVVKSRRAFERLEFVEAVAARSDEWAASRRARDAQARHAYLDAERHRRQRGDLFIAQIIDEEMRLDDPRLR
ncbi:DUF3990 domain-containing protein [Paratractidigestivibacter sp.]|uniref:DUF3990 domain-containing protein n=1 Tax=Paratractidigestivibacter sp. TaxID=2847316 RepID=UPI002AC936CE|nr:DUF3990 domain-containing protein [Paratractidigestivibacter sp.]